MHKFKLFLPVLALCIGLSACGESSAKSSVSDRSVVVSTQELPVSSTSVESDDSSSSEEIIVASSEESLTESDATTVDESFVPEESTVDEETVYVLNTKTMKIHNTWCNSVEKIDPANYKETTESIEELEKQGYAKCKQKGDWNH